MSINSSDCIPGSITVVVPVFNQEKLISRSLESILEQDYNHENINIVVVNDGSTDGTINIVSKYSVKILTQQHAGPGAARNRSLQNLKTEYIAFLDSDDFAKKSWLSDLVSYIEKARNVENIAGVGCAHSLSLQNNQLIKIAWMEHLFRIYQSPYKVTHLGTSGSVYFTRAIQQINGFDETLLTAEDMDLSSRLLFAGYTLRQTKKLLITVEYPKSLPKYLKKQIKNVAYMVRFFLKPTSVGFGKGSYSGYNEYIQGLLFFAFLLACIFLHNFDVVYVVLALILILVLSNVPLLIFISKQRKTANLSKIWPFLVIPYFMARSFAWSIGLVYGIFMLFRNWIKDQ